MSHRGRLATLACVARKIPSEIFLDFDQTNPEITEKNNNLLDFVGDTAVHQPASTRLILENGEKMVVNIVPNACHLESIDPILLGSIKGKQDMKNKPLEEVLPVMIHGDSSITG